MLSALCSVRQVAFDSAWFPIKKFFGIGTFFLKLGKGAQLVPGFLGSAR